MLTPSMLSPRPLGPARKLILHAAIITLFPAAGLSATPFQPDHSPVYKVTPQGELRMHLFLPPGHHSANRRPAIVFFFGGGWRKGSPSQFYPQCAYLASRGMVAASAEYRVSSRHGTSPKECVIDGKSALRWMHGHAPELGIDRNRIAAGGGSAGGHIAAAAALLEGFVEGPALIDAKAGRPGALILFNPTIDNGPGGASHDRVRDYWREFSPLHNINAAAPPTFLLLGDKDHVLPVATARIYQTRMQAAGRRCDLRIYSGRPHGFFNYKEGGNPLYYQTLAECDRFLQSLGYLIGDPMPHPPVHPQESLNKRRRADPSQGPLRQRPPHRRSFLSPRETAPAFIWVRREEHAPVEKVPAASATLW